MRYGGIEWTPVYWGNVIGHYAAEVGSTSLGLQFARDWIFVRIENSTFSAEIQIDRNEKARAGQ